MPENIEATASWLDTLAVPAWGEPMASGIIKAAMSALLNNDAWLREKLEQETRDRGSHVGSTKGVHGATSSATAERLIQRDANGRAHVADPTAASHIATRGWAEQAISGHKPDWPDIRNKPEQATRWPKFAEITEKPSAYPPAAHDHSWGSITGKPTAFPPAGHSHPWGNITEKPSVFPPQAHSHKPTGLTELNSGHNIVLQPGEYWYPGAGWYFLWRYAGDEGQPLYISSPNTFTLPKGQLVGPLPIAESGRELIIMNITSQFVTRFRASRVDFS